jgi:hypothetical protein
MQNYCKTIGALAAASALVAGNASAGTTPTTTTAPASEPASAVSYELHTGYSNQYLFRGVDLGDNLVEVGLDVSGEWNNVGLSAGAWYGSYDVGYEGFHGLYDISTNELDLYAEVSYDFGFATGAVGYIAYLNDDNSLFDAEDYQEVYFSLSRDFGIFATSLTYFWGVEGENNGYSELAFTRSFELSPCFALNLGTNVGFLVEEGEFTSWNSKASLDWAFVEHAKLSPFVAVAVGIEDNWSDNATELVGGTMLSVSF